MIAAQDADERHLIALCAAALVRERRRAMCAVPRLAEVESGHG